LPWTIAAQVHSLAVGAGVNALVAQHSQDIVELAVADAEIVADLDTLEDLMRLQKQRGSFRVCVRLFALAKDRTGRAALEVELRHGSTVGDLRSALGDLTPALRPLLSTAMIALDEEYAGDDVPISPGARLALIPPVSGGSYDR
jgi:molybdopterin converting factor small subunit